MSDIDEKIREGLSGEDEEAMDGYGEELGLLGLMAESFRGKFKAVVIAVFVFVLIFAAIMVYCAVNFFSAEDISTKLNWFAVGLAALIVIGLLRLWYFMELNRISILREVKRLELQISLLRKKLL